MPRIPSTSALVAFEASARNLSFKQAAEELNLTPGAVSRQILALEEMLGVALFERSHKRVALTASGRAYLTDVQGPLKAIADATTRARSASTAEAVSIVAYPTFAIRWLIPRWGRLHDRHPEIDLRLTTSLNPVDFRRDSYDMAIRVAEEGDVDAGLVSHRLLDVVLFPVAAPEVASRLEKPEDLAGVSLIHGDPRPADWTRWLKSAGCRSVDADQGLRFESLNLAFQAAIEGLGVAIGIESLIREDLAAGRLVPLFGIARRSRRSIRLVYPQARTRNANFLAVRDWLLAEAA